MALQWDIKKFDSVASTQDTLKSLDGEEGLVVIAAEQIAGRGRRGREWSCARGNLFLSLLLKPAGKLHELGFVVSLSLLAAFRSYIDAEYILKWPNDILVQDKKISGILIEIDGEKGAAYVGVGVNIKAAPLETAISLRDLGVEIDADDFAQSFLEQLEKHYSRLCDGLFPQILKEWQESSFAIGQEMTVHQGTKQLKGQYQGLDETGALLLKTGDKIEKLSSGDVWI